MTKQHAPQGEGSTAPVTTEGGTAPGKVPATARIQRKPAGAAPAVPPPGADFDDPQAGGRSRADDPFGMHLAAKADDGPPVQRASDRIEVRINSGAIETWMVVKVVDATSFVARDPDGGLHQFMKGAVSHDEDRWQGEGRPRSTHRVYDVLMSPESLAQRAKGGVGRTWQHVQRGWQWVEEQATGQDRATLDKEEQQREAEAASKVTIGTRG